MKMSKIVLIAMIGLVILGAIGLMVNYYCYSLAPYVQPFGCEYKKIGVIYEHKKLKYEYDLSRIADALQSDPQSKFKVIFINHALGVSRMFNEVKYVIVLQKYIRTEEQFIEVDFHNTNFEVYDDRLLSRLGESPTTPDHYIKSNIYQMIDEMPLNDAQKDELKSKVQISCSPTTKIGF